MLLRVFTVLIGLVFFAPVYAIDWEVKPGECVVSSEDEFCDARVAVTLTSPSFIPLSTCLNIDEQFYDCFTTQKMQVDVRIAQDMMFQLTTRDGVRLDSFVLEHKVIDSRPQRRRVRLPWSVF
ncbi:DUF3019 domain-containing protein [Alteromonas sp. H39]|uniref:DUF3019 domain-containing protein n=1 Tax=Alteromonas sp. H39 TaxID=3389876 RepID=UPI0039E1CB8F